MDLDNWLATSPRRLNRLAEALDCKTYLEIGVSEGITFNAVNVETKTGVDPDFQFDWQASHDGTHTRLLPLSSDAFFAKEPIGSRFDLIFIDGLHTYDQTYRDFQNALLHSHPGTVILIDDTIPIDAYSCCRDQDEAIRLRAQSTGIANAIWHGDTYKIMPLIHLFHTAYEYCTIIDQGNPQTLLWR
ncbi:MAG: class I SAM-dependent methyltransferase, partial [Synechococcus sp. ELA619]